MGEGNTPLFRLRNLELVLSWKGRLWAKAEYLNPTGSFKDRGSVIEITEALRTNKKGVVCASTGNMAASLAAYSARARLPCLVVVPEKTPKTKLRQAVICGATVTRTSGGYDDCVKQAEVLAKKNNYLLCGDYEIRRIGQRTIGIELAQSAIRFDGFVVPVGNGTLGCAIAEGLSQESKNSMFIGVQARGADPITQAFTKNSSIIRIIEPKTIASAMCVGNPLDGQLVLQLIKASHGLMCSVTDKEIIRSQSLLVKEEGVFVETSAAATLAALRYLPSTGNFILILTGSGLKEGDGMYER